VAKAFHDDMFPKGPTTTKTPGEDLAEEHTDFRSDLRIKFIQRTVKAAEMLRSELIEHSAWTNAHLDPDTLAKHELVQKHLIQPARNVTNNLNKWCQRSGNPKKLLLFVFDEAASLWIDHEGKDGSPFYALGRVLSLLKDTPIWSFLLSTQPTRGSLLPLRELDRSHRIPTGGIKYHRTFPGPSARHYCLAGCSL
jgi:hypothetical protein